MMDATTWHRGGALITLTSGAGSSDVFVRASERAPGRWTTLLHGYPASSLEWAQIEQHPEWPAHTLALDFVGFGASAKPRQGAAYDIDNQADIVEASWRHHGVKETDILAYDYGAIVVQELLARRAEGRLETDIGRIVLLNAGLLASAYRPTRLQLALATPILGDLLSGALSEPRFAAGWRGVLADPGALDDAAVHEHWLSLTSDNGRRVQRRILSYIAQRRERAARWEGILDPDAPIRGLIWGMADPVSGRHVLDPLRHRLPQASVIEIDDAGHCPHLEAPATVAQTVAELLRPR